MKKSILILAVSLSSPAFADSVCESYPASIRALEINGARIKQVNDVLQETDDKAVQKELMAVLRGLKIGNSSIIEACDELNEKK